jgi:dTDP-glucose 4,6-dehydratase
VVGTPWQLPIDDLDASVVASEADLECWRDARVLVTGGTGFLGSWLVASLLHADALLKLGLKLFVLTRNPDAVPLEEAEGLTLVRGDVRSLPDIGSVDVVVHGAASSSAPFGIGDGAPHQMAATIVDGARSTIDLAARTKARVLFLSSGAVYGPQVMPVSEEMLTSADPLDPHSTYGLAKRLAEALFATATCDGVISAVVARLFAFVGPRLPLEGHYAIGNFLGDALNHRTISVHGDGRPLRSYLYSGELPEWCWALLARGTPGHAYNVGSPEPISIAALAQRIADLAKDPAVEILGSPQSGPAPCYVPIIERIERELGLKPRTDLNTSIQKTISWHRRD